MIPDEAVEAAYKAHLAHKTVRSPGNAKNAIRKALEAAAPHMLAAAWDQGVDWVWDGGPDVYNENPYRTQS